LSSDVIVQSANYGLELVDALTGGPLVGSSAVVETFSLVAPYLVNGSRWVFENLPAQPASFVITADFYVTQTVTTGIAIPNPALGGPGYLATIQMVPRTGYPFPPTLTRVVGLVRLDTSIDPLGSPVPDATVTLTPSHVPPPPAAPVPVPDPSVVVTTTDDGQYTLWFVPQLGESPPIANQITGSVTDGVGHTGSLAALTLVPNSVTYAPTVTLM
jgi:hypothetical protein